MVHRLCHRSGVPVKSAEKKGNRSKVPHRLRERLFLLTRSRDEFEQHCEGQCYNYHCIDLKGERQRWRNGRR